MTIHKLKCWPLEVHALRDQRKTCEVRRADDREFAIGDELHLYPFDPQTRQYTGAPGVSVVITYGTRSCGPANLYLDVESKEQDRAPVPVVVLSVQMLNPFLMDVPK